jgi:chaperonin GroES
MAKSKAKNNAKAGAKKLASKPAAKKSAAPSKTKVALKTSKKLSSGAKKTTTKAKTSVAKPSKADAAKANKISAKAAPAKSVAAKAPSQKNVNTKPSDKSAEAARSGKVLSFAKAKAEADLGDIFMPLDDRVVVSVDPVVEKTQGGIFIPDMAGERPSSGKVVAVGRGHIGKKGRLQPIDVNLGDQVLFSDHSGSQIFIGTAEYLMLRESELIGVVG